MSLAVERLRRLIESAARMCEEEMPAMLARLAFMSPYILPVKWPDDIDHTVR